MTLEAANAAASIQPGETNESRAERVSASIRDGSLARTGLTRLDLSDSGLRALPPEIGSLRALEFLSLGRNPLSALPDGFDRLVNLRVLFFLGCDFETVPRVIGKLPSLFMLSFKANKLSHIPEDAIPRGVGWLILSDNRLERLPERVAECVGMRKLLLAGNRLSDDGLPRAMANLKRLELVRLADNRLTRVPDWIATHETLAWVALAGNPATEPFAEDAYARAAMVRSDRDPAAGSSDFESSKPSGSGLESESSSRGADVPSVRWEALGISDEAMRGEAFLGRGASGAVYAGSLANVAVAVKVYDHAAKTSDGKPADEMAASVLASQTGCRSIVRATARFEREVMTSETSRDGDGDGDGDGEEASPSRPETSLITSKKHTGLVMEFLDPAEWAPLGGPPSFSSVTRDTYAPGTSRSRAEVLAVARGIAAAGKALHAAGVVHGDVYAHNALFRSDAAARASGAPGPAAKLSDFGAAFFYPPGSEIGRALERLDVRAYGVMLEEALGMAAGRGGAGGEDSEDSGSSPALAELAELAGRCVGPRSGRPSFAEIVDVVGEAEWV